MPHNTTELTCPFSLSPVNIDDGMVEIIKTLWSMQIRTSGCCEGYPERGRPNQAYVAFYSAEDAIKAFSIIEFAMRMELFPDEFWDHRWPVIELRAGDFPVSLAWASELSGLILEQFKNSAPKEETCPKNTPEP